MNNNRNICIFTGSGFSYALFKQNTQYSFIKDFIKFSRKYGYSDLLSNNFKKELSSINNIELLMSHYYNLAYSDIKDKSVNYGRRIISLRTAISIYYREKFKDTELFNSYNKRFKKYLINFFNKNNITNENVFFVTTNYDLSIEKVITDIPTFQHYTYPESQIFNNNSINSSNNIPIFKLHGSINWLEERYFENDKLNYVRPLYIHLNKLDDSTIYKYFNDILLLNDNKYYSPILIPFFFQKEIWLGQRWNVLFDDIWNTARNFMEFANRFYFIGYSLPSADHYLFSFLYRIFKNKSSISIDIIDKGSPKPLYDLLKYFYFFNRFKLKYHSKGFIKFLQLK